MKLSCKIYTVDQLIFSLLRAYKYVNYSRMRTVWEMVALNLLKMPDDRILGRKWLLWIS